MNAQTRIALVAAGHDWTPDTDRPGYASTVTFRKGTRYVRVSYDVRGRVTSASWQTGSTGGRQAVGSGKEAQVLSRLQETRWNFRTNG